MPYTPPPSWGFVNADRLLALNGDSGQRMGSAVAGSVSGAAQGALNGLSGLSSSFAHQVGAGGAGTGYSGPTDFTQAPGYAGVANALDLAGNRVRALGSDAGVGGELLNTYGATTAGGNRFDTFLTRQGGAGPLGQVQQQFGGVSNALGLARGAAQGQVQQQQAGGPTPIVRVDQSPDLPTGQSQVARTQVNLTDKKRDRIGRRSNQGGW